MRNCAKKILSCHHTMPLLMAFMAAAALGMALLGQYGFGLQPCVLCVIQRYPFGIIIALGLLGFILSFKCSKSVVLMMSLIGLTFLVNAVIAFYHTGVELHWWKSFLEGCAVPDLGSSPEDIIAHLSQAKAARCDEIPWADPVLHLSMANWNVLFCLALGFLSFCSACKIYKTQVTTNKQ